MTTGNTKPVFRLMAAFALAVTLQGAKAFETVNTATLATATTAALPACLRYQTTGVCLFLVCSMFECHIETSAKIGNFNPDLVVSPYNTHGAEGGNPWLEAKAITGGISSGAASALSSALSGLSGLIPTGGNYSHGKHQNMLYKEADALGHPLASFLSQATFGQLCPSDATSFMPYYLSGLDVLAWRWSIPEIVYPQTWVPGLQEIGRFPLNTWAGVYPRTGTVTQSDDAKSAAVVAQRAGDFITRNGQPHVYLPLGQGQDGYSLSAKDGLMVWSPGALVENSNRGGDWQMVSPMPTPYCEVFGSNDTLSPTGWGGGKVAASGGYVFTLWRPYQCCRIQGLFLGAVDFMPYPTPNLQ